MDLGKIAGKVMNGFRKVDDLRVVITDKSMEKVSELTNELRGNSENRTESENHNSSNNEYGLQHGTTEEYAPAEPRPIEQIASRQPVQQPMQPVQQPMQPVQQPMQPVQQPDFQYISAEESNPSKYASTHEESVSDNRVSDQTEISLASPTVPVQEARPESTSQQQIRQPVQPTPPQNSGGFNYTLNDIRKTVQCPNCGALMEGKFCGNCGYADK